MSEIIIKKLTDEEIAEKGILQWSTWSCEKSIFPWEYTDKESCYILEGKVDIETENGELISIEPGDFVVFPKGLKCTWHVHEAINKHYVFT